MLKLTGYKCTELIDDNGKYSLYRGFSVPNGQPVVIKAPSSARPHFSDLSKLMHEYEVSGQLKLDGVVTSYGLEKHGTSLALIVEDFGGIPLKSFFQSKPLSLPTFFFIAIQLSSAIAELHLRDIIHKDIHPGNIMIDPETLKVKIGGFGLSTSLTLVLQAFEGTPAYMSPEQTGRMNRAVDARTDLYSLGVTFYELLSGQPPFQAHDQIEWTHAHIAREPVSLAARNPLIPRTVSDIVMRLLAKTVEERYQSAYGVLHDLENCYKMWSETGRIDDFPLGRMDLFDHFYIPQKVYGREKEQARLLEAFNRVCGGTAEMMLIAGHAGIGKTTLVKEMYKPVVEEKGYYISGKFAQLNRDIPYAPIIQAFRGLIMQLLSEHSGKKALWKEQLVQELGANVSVIAEVLPELRQIIGMTPAVEALSPAELQNRFQQTFRQFVQVFTKRQHPLVIFLDDLQWADSASLELLEVIMTYPQNRYLFVIGAYRDHEVSRSHPFLLQVDKIRKSGVVLQTVHLGPLHMTELNQMTADTLHTVERQTWDLTAILFRKSAGNPFFFKLLFESVYKERWLKYNAGERRWEWDLAGIEKMADIHEMLDFLIDKIGRLGRGTREVLSLAACLGNRFDLKIVASMNGTSVFRTAEALKAAVTEGLVLPLNDTAGMLLESSAELEASGYFREQTLMYQFLHDRIQQAAYSFIGGDRRIQAHLAAGKYMLEHADPRQPDGLLFETVNHFNETIDSISWEADRELLLDLSVRAGRKAKASSAFEAASRYFQIAIRFVAEDDWSSRFDFCFELYLEHTECLYLSGNSAMAESLYEELLGKASCRIERAKVRRIQITQYANRGNYKEAIDVGLQILQEFGIVITRFPSAAAVLGERKATQQLIKDHIPELIDLPEVANPDIQASMDVMLSLVLPALVSDKGVFTLLISKFIELSLKHGNSVASPLAYGALGIHLSCQLQEYKTGQELVKAAFQLTDKSQALWIQAKAYYMLGKVLSQWEAVKEQNLDYLAKAVQFGLNSGDFIYAGVAMAEHVNFTYTRGTLDDLYRLVQTYLPIMAQTKNPFRIITFYNYLQLISDLEGLTNDITSLDIERLNEHPISKEFEGEEFKALLYFRNYTYKTQMNYLLGNYMEAVHAAEAAVPYLEYAAFLPHVPEHHFYYSLALCAAWVTLSTKDKRKQWSRLKQNQKQMKVWAAVSPHNYLHKYQLITAEMARISGDESKAVSFYHQSIISAREAGYIQNEAIASELFAKIYLAQGIHNVAQVYMTNAYEGYLKWGAKVKARHLLDNYPNLLQLPPVSAADFIIETAVSPKNPGPSEEMDLASVFKAWHSFSEDMDMQQQLQNLMTIIIENAGAQKGCLIVEKKHGLVVEVAVQTDRSELLLIQSVPVDRCDFLPSDVVRHVASTLTAVRLDDARLHNQFGDNAYLSRQQPKSILCIPVTKPNHPNLILYLENNLATHAFAMNRVDVLQMLSFQAYYVKTLLDSYGNNTLAISKDTEPSPLVDPLTERELEVLNLMAKGLSNQEIGDQLGVVVGTVKNHIRSIFGKLDVNKRVKAIAQAKQFNLITKDPV